MRKPALIALSFIVISLAIYFPALKGEFVIDDYGLVVQNTLVHSLSNISTFFSGSTFFNGDVHKMFGGFYRPINTLYYSSLYTLFGPQPFYFHVTQIVVHALNGFLLFLLLNYFLAKIQTALGKKPETISYLLALLFLVHPLNAGGVAYIAASQDPIFFLLGMTTLLLLTKYGYTLLTALLLFVILLTKEAGILFFALIFVYLYLFDRRSLLKHVVVTAICLTLYLLLRCQLANLCNGAAADHTPLAHLPISGYLLQVPKIIFFYLSTFLYPQKLLIAQHWYVKNATLNDFYFPLIFVSLFFLAALYFLFKLYYKVSLEKKTKEPVFTVNKLYSFFLLWFCFGLGLHLHLIPLDFTVSDQWFYFPMAGLLGVFGVLIVYLTPYTRKKTVYIVFLLIISIFSVRTFYRAGNWQTQYGLLLHDYRYSAPSFDLENNIGFEKYNRGDIKGAQNHFKRAKELAPDWPIGWDNLGVTYEVEGKLEKAEQTYKKGLTVVPYYSAYEHYAALLIKRGKVKEAREFLKNKALPTFPYNTRLKELYKKVTTK